ncbi:MAG: Hsp20/alpha crystallin family protein [Candidatus Omnitrophota bacterium]
MKRNILVTIIAILILILAVQTGYLLKLKQEFTHKKDASNEQVYQPHVRYAVPAQPTQTAGPTAPRARAMSPMGPGLFDEDEWDPFREMEEMQRRMNRLFQDSYVRGVHSPAWGGGSRTMSYNPDVDIQESDNAYLVKVDLPGIDKDKLSIKIQNNQLVLSGQRETQKKRTDDDGTYYQSERSFGSFMRSIPLPADVDAQAMTAKSEQGVLTVTIPKIAGAVKTSKTVPIE